MVHQAGTEAVGIPVGHVGNCVFGPGRVGAGRVGTLPLGRVGALFPKRQSAKSGKSQYPILEFQWCPRGHVNSWALPNSHL